MATSYRIYRFPGMTHTLSFDDYDEAFAYCMAHRFDDADERFGMFRYDDNKGIVGWFFSKCPRPFVTASGVRKYLDKPSNM